MTSTNRVYDPVAPVAPKPGSRLDSRRYRHEVRGHTNRGTTSDQNVIMAKNKIDIQYPQSKKQYLRIKSVHCYGKRALEKVN
jgi:hypothetical protein